MRNNEYGIKRNKGMRRRQRRNAKINVYIATSLCHFE